MPWMESSAPVSQAQRKSNRGAGGPRSSASGNALIAIGLGAAAALALPPWHAVPLVFVAFTGLILLLDRTPTMAGAILLGWSFGLGHFVAGLYWIGNSFFVDAERFGALAVPAVLGLSAGLALFPALACAITWRFSVPGWARALAFAGAWTLAEWLRGTVLSGFPWNLIGYVWTVADAPLQLAAYTGAYGLSFVTVLLAALPAILFRRGLHLGLRLAAPAASVVGVIALWLSGADRLAEATSGEVDGVRLRIVQASIPQAMKWRPSEREKILSEYLDLSRSPAQTLPTHLIWPETAVPFDLVGDDGLRNAVARVVPEGGALLTGILRRDMAEDRGNGYFNSLVAIDAQGQVNAIYDKIRLVPFGEFVPFPWILSLSKMTEGASRLLPGETRRSLSAANLPSLHPMICYEAIFPGDRVVQGWQPQWILNVTNDAWFGDSAGPYQHFQAARVRAIEQGIPLVRAANTGISAIIDAFGRVQASLPFNRVGVLDSGLPSPLPERTRYARYGDEPVLAAAGAALWIGLLVRLTPNTRET